MIALLIKLESARLMKSDISKIKSMRLFFFIGNSTRCPYFPFPYLSALPKEKDTRFNTFLDVFGVFELKNLAFKLVTRNASHYLCDCAHVKAAVSVSQDKRANHRFLKMTKQEVHHSEEAG